MTTQEFPEVKYFTNLDSEALWKRYCGFLDLSVQQFTEIQEHLMVEQIQLIGSTPIGQRLMPSGIPTTLDQFRKTVPITSYDDYVQLLGQCPEDVLPEPPQFWCHTAGRGGRFKWIPYTKRAFDRVARHGIGVAILSAADRKGDIFVEPEDRVLVNLAPRPYASGTLMHHLSGYFPFQFIPPVETAEEMDFTERTKLAFNQGLDLGIDFIFSVSTVLVKIGERFADHERSAKFTAEMLRPRALARMLRAWMRSRLAHRPMAPSDLWSPKGIVTFGVDTAIYEDEIAKTWGRRPYQVYGTTETMVGAVQSWNKKGLTFVPDIAFWEFIPQSEWSACRRDPTYQPRTVLLNELEAGEQYELVLSHFHGMPLMRYRIGDVIKVIALQDEETGVRLPQVVFQARANEIIDLAGLTQLDERTLWQAIENTGASYDEWTAYKEYDTSGKGYLRLLIELKEPYPLRELESSLEAQLRVVDVDYRDIQNWLGQERVVLITLLPRGTFSRYAEEKSREGSSFAHHRPSHINPPQAVIHRLLELSHDHIEESVKASV